MPPLVRRARAQAAQMGFTLSSTDATGRLLRLLAGAVQGGTIDETGAGCGVGSAWIVAGLRPGVRFVTVEQDAERAAAMRDLLSAYPHAHVIHGDWTELLSHGPFALLFADGGADLKDARGAGSAALDRERVLAALQPGGLIVLDDMTPEADWPLAWRGRPDPARAFWLNDARLAATEIVVDPAGGPSSAVLLAART